MRTPGPEPSGTLTRPVVTRSDPRSPGGLCHPRNSEQQNWTPGSNQDRELSSCSPGVPGPQPPLTKPQPLSAPQWPVAMWPLWEAFPDLVAPLTTSPAPSPPLVPCSLLSRTRREKTLQTEPESWFRVSRFIFKLKTLTQSVNGVQTQTPDRSQPGSGRQKTGTAGDPS